MVRFAALDVSLEATMIGIVDEDGAITDEGKVRACPEAIRGVLAAKAPELRRLGLETGPLERAAGPVPHPALWTIGWLTRRA